MDSIGVKPLAKDLSFGARVTGVTREALADAGIRRQLNEVFEAKGMIVFEDIEPSSKMQVEVSEVFGPLKDHPVKIVQRVDQDAMPGVIAITTDPDGCLVEIDGKPLLTWQP